MEKKVVLLGAAITLKTALHVAQGSYQKTWIWPCSCCVSEIIGQTIFSRPQLLRRSKCPKREELWLFGAS